MKAKTVCQPPFQVTTFREGQAVIIETLDTEIAARTRFTSAVDLCTALDNGHVHKIELRAGAVDLMDTWSSI